MTDIESTWLTRLLDLQARTRDALRESLERQDIERTSAVDRDGSDGDTIFAIDVDAERLLLDACEEWAKDTAFVIVAEGIEPETGRAFHASGVTPKWRLIFDPIDGTRGLMFDKRSAWALAAVAPDRGMETRLSDLGLAVMTELPITRQGRADVLWAARGGPAQGKRVHLDSGEERPLHVRPSQATTVRHGFATICNFFQGGKELTARLDEELIGRAIGGWDYRKAEVYSDQYISSGGQLGELILGRDRFVMDARPLVHRAMGYESTLCSRPYDVCTALIAEAAGCVITALDGSPLDAPLDTTTNVGFVAYANRALAESMQPHVDGTLRDHGLLGP